MIKLRREGARDGGEMRKKKKWGTKTAKGVKEGRKEGIEEVGD